LTILLVFRLGFERYWYWGTGYWPILDGIAVDTRDTRYRYRYRSRHPPLSAA